MRGQRQLQTSVPGSDIPANVTSPYGPSTVLVMGNTLFFHAFIDCLGHASDTAVPYLSSLVFDAYREGASADDLVHVGIKALKIIEMYPRRYYSTEQVPLYPAGPQALTVSAACDDYVHIDVVIALLENGTNAVCQTYVHTADNSSVGSTSRDVLSVPGYSCRAFMDGTAPLCYLIGMNGERYTWTPAQAPHWND